MLLRLLPEQIANHWEYIKYAIVNSVPLEAMKEEMILNNLLESLLSSGMQCWWEVRDEENPVVVAQVITTIYDDKCSGLLMLRIYSLYGYNDLSMDEIKDGFETLSKYAKHLGCSYMDAFTTIKGIVSLADRFQFDTMHYISRRL